MKKIIQSVFILGNLVLVSCSQEMIDKMFNGHINGVNPGVTMSGLEKFEHIKEENSNFISAGSDKLVTTINFMIFRCNDGSKYFMTTTKTLRADGIKYDYKNSYAYFGKDVENGCLTQLIREGSPEVEFTSVDADISVSIQKAVGSENGNNYESLKVMSSIDKEPIPTQYIISEVAVKGGPTYDKAMEIDQRKLLHSAMQCADLIKLKVRKLMYLSNGEKALSLICN